MGLAQRELCTNRQSELTVARPFADPLRWFAVVIKAQYEHVVHDGLRQKDLESFLPLYWATRRWSDRVKRLQLPLFPGYVFCRFEHRHRLAVLQTPGVRSILSFGGTITPIADHEIEQIRALLASGSPVEPWRFLKTGQRVRIDGGPLTGLEGVLAETDNARRVVVSLDLLQRSVAVQLDRDRIIPL
jgi:transcription antitermination factor NusG